jgi:hypothetical protein
MATMGWDVVTMDVGWGVYGAKRVENEQMGQELSSRA